LGQLQGTWTEFDENGRISLRGTYENNRKEGRWLSFENGKPVHGIWYRKGIITKEVDY
ncbi:MAG: hypothetical protein RL168_221, partial [Bacteroidota bacterium]